MNFDITISIDENIIDPLAMGQVSVVRDILNIAEQVTNAGRTVIVQRNFTNSPAEIISTFTKPEQVKEWRDLLDKTQATLGRESIS